MGAKSGLPGLVQGPAARGGRELGGREAGMLRALAPSPSVPLPLARAREGAKSGLAGPVQRRGAGVAATTGTGRGHVAGFGALTLGPSPAGTGARDGADSDCRAWFRGAGPGWTRLRGRGEGMLRALAPSPSVPLPLARARDGADSDCRAWFRGAGPGWTRLRGGRPLCGAALKGFRVLDGMAAASRGSSKTYWRPGKTVPSRRWARPSASQRRRV